MTQPRIWSAIGLAGAVVAVFGIVLLFLPTPAPTFGWAAYQPLDQTVFLPMLPAPTVIWGTLALAVGLLSAAFSAGFLFGHASGRRPRFPHDVEG